jgi:hypothetical protein
MVNEVFHKRHPPPTVVVANREGTITRNCSACGRDYFLPPNVFQNALQIFVACPKCRQQMTSDILKGGVYSFSCKPYGIQIKFADLLPSWNEISR